MNKINKLFSNKPGNLLSVYFTAGFPQLDDTIPIIKTLEEAGVDMIEIGMPFSDPMADGPVIQNSSRTALNNGMSIKRLFRQLEEIKQEVSVPLLLMGYLNPVMQFGMKNFCLRCQETGIDGAIIPDMPYEIYQEAYQVMFQKHDLHNIFLVAPTTKEERLKKIIGAASGFIYMVSSSSTTGNQIQIQTHLNYVSKIRRLKPDLPVMVGFGIDNHEKFQAVCQQADGAIIGSAFIKMLSEEGYIKSNIYRFIQSIKTNRYDYSVE